MFGFSLSMALKNQNPCIDEMTNYLIFDRFFQEWVSVCLVMKIEEESG